MHGKSNRRWLSQLPLIFLSANRIQSASRVQKSAIQINKGISRKGVINVDAVEKALNHKVSHQDVAQESASLTFIHRCVLSSILQLPMPPGYVS
jgi:hypothetical protein